MQCEINHINKIDFLFLYLQAHASTSFEKTIQNGLRTARLVLYNLYKVLSKFESLLLLSPALQTVL